MKKLAAPHRKITSMSGFFPPHQNSSYLKPPHLCVVKQRNLFSSPLHHPSLCWRAVAMRQMLPDFFFFYMHLKAQVQQQLIFDDDFTETTQCVSTKTNYRAIFTGESKVWSITVIRMPQHEQLLNQCSPAWAWCKILLCVGAPLPKALSITLILYYLFHPSPGQDWESLLSQAVTTAFVSFLSAAVQWLLLL